MATLMRDDGVQFALQSYREQFTQRRGALLKDELRLLAQTNGQFVRLFKQSGGGLEAVFSKDPGYLFGETVWHHFSKPRDLVYCEALEDGEHALLVIVHNSMIHIDAKLPLADIRQEVLSVATEHARFWVKVYGDIPIDDPNDSEDAIFNAKQIISYERLERSLLAELPKIATLQLLSIEQAFQEIKIHQFSVAPWLTAVVIVVVVGWLLWPSSSLQTHEQAQLTPLQQLRIALNQPDISQQLVELRYGIEQVLALPGWTVTQANFDGKHLNFQMHSFGGATHYLRQWGGQHNMKALITNDGINLGRSIYLKPRPAARRVANSQQTLSQIIDRMMHVLPGRSVSIGQYKRRTSFNETSVGLNVKGVSTNILSLIGNVLTGLPITLHTASIHVNNGLLSGKIELTVIGS